ncbi:MAG: c-type cytochrome [Bacteroidetes bacterium]|nr:c-type cytochrome [Bacteroidota bacterium]
MAKEKDILLKHNYDGIHEYDNPLPGWWLILFILTVVWGILYLMYYQVIGAGMTPVQEYQAEMKEAGKTVKAASLVFSKEELSPNTDAKLLAAGKKVFTEKCSACHGSMGEGGIGPNLTDDYWIHGGTMENILTTISNGVPEKGMLSWKTLLKKEEILDVAYYIYSLHGTNPPNMKKPQGELFQRN